MPDDPRTEAGASRLMMSHPSWFKRLSRVRNRNSEDAGHPDALYAARTLAEAVLKGADPADPLRALLADEDRAVELFRSQGLTKNQAWRALAALREVARAVTEPAVAGLSHGCNETQRARPVDAS